MEEKRSWDRKIPEPAMPRQITISICGTEGVERQDCDNGNSTHIVQKFDMFGGIIHLGRCHLTENTLDNDEDTVREADNQNKRNFYQQKRGFLLPCQWPIWHFARVKLMG